MNNLILLQTATLAARVRTGDKSITTSAKAGRVRVESVVFDSKGIATINVLSNDLTIDQAIDFLNLLEQ